MTQDAETLQRRLTLALEHVAELGEKLRSREREYPGDLLPPDEREELIRLLNLFEPQEGAYPSAQALIDKIRSLPKRSNPAVEAVEIVERPGAHELSCWFGLSYASFCVLPRVFMEAMPDEWQGKMADLLKEYGVFWSCRNSPTLTTAISFRNSDGKFVDAPRELCNYRRPDWAALEKYR